MRLFLLRAIRKVAHVLLIVLDRGARFAERVEGKALRMLNGSDYTFRLRDEVTVEEEVFRGLPGVLPVQPSLPALGRTPTVCLLLPSLGSQSFFGGVATALIVAGKLAQRRGLPLRIVQTIQASDGRGVDDFLRGHGIDLGPHPVEVLDVSARRFDYYGYLDLHPRDILVASAWWDAHLVKRLPLEGRFVYLIQDFEPIFYPNGDDAVLAERTYHGTDFVPVCNTELMHTFMSSRGYAHIARNGLWFEPAVARPARSAQTLSGAAGSAAPARRRLFLYARPGVPRNLFRLSLMALDRAFDEPGLDLREWDLCMAGQDKLPNIRLSGGGLVENLGKLAMDDYLALMATVDVAVSPMMAPHPNYPTLEFAAAGAAVVTTRWETKQSLDRYSSNILMSDLDVDSLTACIVRAGSMTREERLANLAATSIPDSWDEQLAGVLERLDDLIAP